MSRTLLIVLAASASLVAAQPTPASRVDATVNHILTRPEYVHANAGVEAIDLATGKVVYARNADPFFVPGSTTKLVTAGAMLAKASNS